MRTACAFFSRALNPGSSLVWDLSFFASFAGGTTRLGRTFAWWQVLRPFGAHQQHLSRAIEVRLLLLHVRVGRVSSTRRKLPSFFFLTRRDPTKQTDAFATHRDEDLLSFPDRFLGGMGRVAALVPPGFVDRTWTVSERSSIGKGPFVDRSWGCHVRRFEGVDRPHVAAGFEDTRPNPRWEFLLHSGVVGGPWGRREGGEVGKACGRCEDVRGGGNLHRHHVRARISPSVHARARGRRNSISVNRHACIHSRHRPRCLETR